jgi:hypothetical protein
VAFGNKKVEKAKVKLSPQGFEMLRIPYCLDNLLIDGSKFVSVRPHFTPQKHYFF